MKPREIFLATCIILATVLGAYTVYRLAPLLIVIFVAVIFASTVRPILQRLTRYRVPRWASILLIYGVTALGLVALITIAIPPVVALIMDIFQDDALVSKLSYSLMRTGLSLQRQFEIYIPVMSLPARFQEFADLANQTMQEQAWPVASNAIYVIGQILLAVVISIYWLTARRTALRGLLRITPRPHQQRISKIWIDTEDTLGAYFRGQLILALIVGAASFVGLFILRVPNPLPLAVIAGLLEFVPFVGPMVAAIPALLMALTVSPVTALLVGLWYLLVQQFEGNYLIPRIMGKSVSLHPLIILVAIFAGFQINGVIGALLAVPVAGVIQVVLRYLPKSTSEIADVSTSTVPANEETSAPPPADVTDSGHATSREDEAAASPAQPSNT